MCCCCCCSVAQLCPTLCNPMNWSKLPCPSLSPGVCSNSCRKESDTTEWLNWTELNVHWISDAIQPSHPLLSRSPPAFNLSQHQGLFQWVGCLHQLQHRSFQWIFRVDSFRTDWFDLFAVQGTLKSLLQHHSLKASILQCSAFFMVQLSHLYMTTGKTVTLMIWTFVSKVMSLLFNASSRLVITFLPRSKSIC